MNSIINQDIRAAKVSHSRLRAQVRALFGRRCRPQPPARFPQTISHYELRKEIGAGARGTVYLARDQRLDRWVAVKIPRPYRDRESRQRFWREAECALALDHPNIVTVYEIRRCQPTDFIVMEYVPGKTLDHLIPRRGLPLAACLGYALQMTQALAAIHEAGMMYRDLKPENLIVTNNGVVKLLDFGLAKVIGHRRSCPPRSRTARLPETREGTILGTVGYMSPEQAEGRAANQRSDIFSFGAIFYEMLSGRRAFQENSDIATMCAILNQEPSGLPARIPPRVAGIVRRCLAKDPSRRYQSAQKLALEIARFMPLDRNSR